MIRVLQCIGSLEFGGAQSFLMEVYRKIDRNAFQFDFVVFEGEVKDNSEEIKALGGRIFECPHYSPKKHFIFVKWWKEFFKTHPEYRVLHSHLRSCVSLILPMAKKAGCTTIVHSHSTSNGSGLKSFAKAVLQWPIRHMADYLFACSTTSGQWLYGNKVISKDNFRVVPNCIDVSRFQFSQENRDVVRKEYGIAADDFVIGHVGRFHPVKNHKFLIEIFAEICKEKHNAKLLLIGEGELLEHIQSYCANLGLADKVIFTGSQRDTAPYYSAMDAFVFPSLWEGVPVSVVEAQAAGVKCYISDTITKDVCCTDLVITKRLSEPAVEWAQVILDSQDSKERLSGKTTLKQLALFDSQQVAKELCKFYQNTDQKA